VTPEASPPRPSTTCEDTPNAPACIPDSPAPTRDTAPPGGGTSLPFTGPGDVVLAIVLALLAASGGILLLLGATGREAIDGLNRRSMASPSGFKVAYRELLKRQLGD